MTPVLCLNCGKTRSEHYTHLLDDASKLYCHKYSPSTWMPPLDESSEQRTVEAIAAWLDGNAEYYKHNRNLGPYTQQLAYELRSGAWKEKP